MKVCSFGILIRISTVSWRLISWNDTRGVRLWCTDHRMTMTHQYDATMEKPNATLGELLQNYQYHWKRYLRNLIWNTVQLWSSIFKGNEFKLETESEKYCYDNYGMNSLPYRRKLKEL